LKAFSLSSKLLVFENYGGQVKEDEMVKKWWSENMMQRDHADDQGIEGEIILE
jgi:hypothetical protein